MCWSSTRLGAAWIVEIKTFLPLHKEKMMPQLSLFSLCLGFLGQVASHFLTSRSFEVLHGLLMVWTYSLSFSSVVSPL
jgi:hypothetical protein